MNHTTHMAAELEAAQAEIQALRDGNSALLAYIGSSKFSTGEPGSAGAGYVNVSDIRLRIREAMASASDASSDAWHNATGPAPADGSHSRCAHGTYAGVPQVNGWHCPVCGESLVSDTPWSDTDARAIERMRLHWIARHKV